MYGSTEVSTHLPGHAYTFSTVDSDWRELMMGVARNTAVISVCLKDGERNYVVLYNRENWQLNMVI